MPSVLRSLELILIVSICMCNPLLCYINKLALRVSVTRHRSMLATADRKRSEFQFTVVINYSKQSKTKYFTLQGLFLKLVISKAVNKSPAFVHYTVYKSSHWTLPSRGKSSTALVHFNPTPVSVLTSHRPIFSLECFPLKLYLHFLTPLFMLHVQTVFALNALIMLGESKLWSSLLCVFLSHFLLPPSFAQIFAFAFRDKTSSIYVFLSYSILRRAEIRF